MKQLRAILIVILAISIPLPSLAAAFGAPCEMMQEMQSSAQSYSMEQDSDHIAAQSPQEKMDDCCCGDKLDCLNCDAPCATSSVATFNKLQFLPVVQGVSTHPAPLLAEHTLAPHPEELIRPPITS